jgi:predicted phage tail component-like protein
MLQNYRNNLKRYIKIVLKRGDFLNNFSFNGITKPYLQVLKGSRREPWAPVEWIYQDIPNRPGSTTVKKKTKPRPFPIPVAIEANNIEDLQKVKEDLANWLILDQPAPLIPDDEPDRTYYAVVDGSFDPEDLVRLGQGVIPFLCPNPYKYGVEEEVSVHSSINVQGSIEVNPIIRVSFSGSTNEYLITHEDTGKSIKIVFNFVAGDVLEIDSTTRKVRINGNVNMTSYTYASRPFKLYPGYNGLLIQPSTVTTTTIKYRPGWK